MSYGPTDTDDAPWAASDSIDVRDRGRRRYSWPSSMQNDHSLEREPSIHMSSRREVIDQLGNFYAAVYGVELQTTEEDRAYRILVELARLLQLSWVGMWRFDWEAGEAVRMTILGRPGRELDRRFPFERMKDLVDSLVEDGPQIMSINDPRLRAIEMSGREASILAVPIPADGRPFGVWCGEKRDRAGRLTEDDLDVAVGLTAQFADAFADPHDSPAIDWPLQRLQLEAMIQDFDGAVSAFDVRGGLVYFNDQECELFDISPDECWIGQDLHDFLSRKRRLSLTGARVAVDEFPVTRALRGERVEDVHQMVERRDGERRYIRTSARPVYVHGGLIGAVSISRDMTRERNAAGGDSSYLRQLEHALRRSQAISEIVVEINENAVAMDRRVVSSFAIERICSEFDAVRGMLWLRDEDGVFRIGSAWHLDQHHLEGIDFDADHVGFSGPAIHRNRPLVVQVSDVNLSPEMERCFGDLTSLMIIPMTVRGQQTGLAILGFDEPKLIDEADIIFASVWGRQCAQGIDTAQLFETLETSHNRLVAVIDQLQQGVIVGDVEGGKVLVANETAETMWGFTIEEGMNVRDLPILTSDGERIPPNDNPMLRPIRTRESRTGEPLIIVQADGTQLEVVASHAPVFDARKRVTGFVSVFQNRSDFKMLDRSKDEFISVIAHELRNPLTSLRGNLQLLQRRVRKREDENVPDELGRIDTAITQADRISDLVSRMLDVSRVDMGSLDVSPEPADASDIVREVVGAYLAGGDDRHVNLTIPDSMPVVWDAARIQQVVANLLQNTSRYAPGAPVDIDMHEEPGDRVLISVRDHGPGVPAKIRRRLFKQYYRFDDGQGDSSAAYADGSRGLGIGLYVSARLVRQHGGTLTVHNHREGGAVFTMILPTNAARDTGRQDR